MAPRTTRATTAAKRLAIRRSRMSIRTSQEEEFKDEDPDAQYVLEQQTQNQTPQKAGISFAESDAAIFSGTFLAAAGRNTSRLSARLKETWETLQNVPSRQRQREDGVMDNQTLGLVAAELLQERLLKHKDKHIRSLVACCLVEILRVSSPDSPFSSNEDLYRVFQLLIEQLRALTPEQTTTSSDLLHFQVLESLATARSCLLVVGLDFTAEEDEERVMVQLFQALFDAIGEEHSAKVENLMLSIMVTCIEETNDVEQPLLDVILRPLVDASSHQIEMDADNGIILKRSPSHMARELIRRTSDYLQNPLSNFFNSILIDGPGRLGSQKILELKEHVYTLIYEVHKVNPSLLLYVLPNVCLQFQVDEVATRSEAISIMGKLFASSHADYGHQYMKNFRDFLGRFRDASKEIRLQMITVSVPIWEQKTDLANLLEKEFILRLSDPEWEVRQLVVHELCDFAANYVDLISDDCIRAVGERMKDKKVALRKETMTGLSQVFSTHISSLWEDNEGKEDKLLSLNHRTIPVAHIKKLGWIPGYVLKCYAYPQQELKLRVIQLLDDFLLPKALSERTRTNGLLFIFHMLDATSIEALRRIFSERAKCQEVCKNFVEFKVQHRHRSRAAEVDIRTLEKAKQQLFDGLSPLFSDVQTLNKLLDQLSMWKDHSVFKHMGELCDFSKSQHEYRHARDQLIRCVGSKTPLGEFLKKLCRKFSLLTMNQGSVGTLLDFLLLSEGRPSRENRSIVDLLVMASNELPELFAPFIHDKVTAILVESKNGSDSNLSVTSDEDDEEEPLLKDPRVVLGALHVLANYSRHWADTIGLGNAPEAEVDNTSTLSNDLIVQLHKFCIGDSYVQAHNANTAKESRAAELAAFAISHFYGSTKETAQLISKLCSEKNLASVNNFRALPALQSLGVFTKRCSHTFSVDKSPFASLWTHLIDDLIGKDEHVQPPGTPTSKERTTKCNRPAVAKFTEVRCLAIKVAVNLLVHGKSTMSSSGFLKGGTKLIKLLFGILRSKGKSHASTPALAATFRATASCSLMKIMRIRQLEASVTVSEWHLLGLTVQDSSEDVRRKFLKKLTSHLMKQPVQHPHKYLSYLALSATESSTSVKKVARNLLRIAVERMRRMFDATSSYESEITSPDQIGNGSPLMSAIMVPEYTLPYVIHLLAHHPKFPVQLVERTPTIMVLHSALWTDQLAYLGFFLDGLVSTNAAAADNIAFLLQILTKLSQCHDVASPDGVNIYSLIDSTTVLLKKKIKKQSNLKPFPGTIFLPKYLYSPGRPSTLATPGGRKEPEAPELLGVNLVSRGQRLSTSLSPIKPRDSATHFMKMNSPPGSSLKTSLHKRKRSAFMIIQREVSDAEEKNGNNEDDTSESLATPPRRHSVLGKRQPGKRTFVDDSSDSRVESDAFVPRRSTPIASYSKSDYSNGPASASSSLLPARSRRTGAIVEEKGNEDEVKCSSKERVTRKAIAAEDGPSCKKPNLRNARA